MPLIEMIRKEISRPTLRSNALKPSQMFLAALRYYSTGDHLRMVGDTLGIGIVSVSRSISIVTEALFSHASEFIRLPNGAEITSQKEKFFKVNLEF